MAGDAGRRAGAQRLPRRLGAVPPAHRRRHAIPVIIPRRRQKRPTRGGLLSEPSRAALDRCAGADIVRRGRPAILARTWRSAGPRLIGLLIICASELSLTIPRSAGFVR